MKGRPLSSTVVVRLEGTFECRKTCFLIQHSVSSCLCEEWDPGHEGKSRSQRDHKKTKARDWLERTDLNFLTLTLTANWRIHFLRLSIPGDDLPIDQIIVAREERNLAIKVSRKESRI